MVHYAAGLSRALARHARVTVLSAPRTAAFFSEGQLFVGVDTKYTGIFRLARQVAQVRRAIKDSRPDVIHITGRSHISPFLMRTFRRYPTVVTLHDIVPHPGEASIVGRAIAWLHTRIGCIYIVHGLRSRELLLSRRRIDPNRIEIIPHGEYEFLAQSPDLETGARNKVLFFGRILEYKGLPDFISALRTVQQSDADVAGVIAGKGDFAPYEELVTSGFTIVNRYIDESEFPSLFAGVICVVCPYLEGSQSGVIALAYGYGIPVIVTDVGDLPDVVIEGVTGFVVPPHSPDAVAERVLRLRQSPELARRMGENAKRFAQTELSWDSIAKRTMDTYTRALRLHA